MSVGRVRHRPSVGLLGFLVVRVLAAPLAELLDAHAVRMSPLVLGQRVVPALAGAAREGDDVAHGLADDLGDDARPHRPAPPPAPQTPGPPPPARPRTL